MHRLKLWLGTGMLIGLVSCDRLESRQPVPKDTLTSGTIRISVDEAFRPVMEEELKVFTASNPGAHIIANYKPEAECLKDLQKDSIRMVFVTRGLTPTEDAYYLDKLQYPPSYEALAYDALTVIVNRASPDSLFTTDEIREVLTGRYSTHYTVVFDGINATSTIRFAMDSILRGQPFDTHSVFAATNSTGVIEYVESHPDAMGFVGADWIANPEDSTQMGYRKKVRICGLTCQVGCPAGAFVQPYQENILTKSYPFTRGLYYIKKENYDGLATGFVNFLQFQRGQLIFRRAYLVPALLPFIIRNAKVEP